MKQNYEFPYHFSDRTQDAIVNVQTSIENDELVVQVEITDFQANTQIDTAIEFEGSETFYRSLHILKESRDSIRLPYKSLSAKLSYSIWLIAKEEGQIELDGLSDFHEKGDCIGLLHKDVIVLEHDNGVAGLIKVAQTTNDTIDYDLASDWITIKLPAATYKEFNHWHKDPRNTPMALASFGFGCIQYAILQALSKEDHKLSKWWETISLMLEEHGYDLEEFSEDEVPGATNKILKNCIHEMIIANSPINEESDSNSLS
jgi:hypothetical protein